MLAVEEAEAWREYLETTRKTEPERYDEVEPWAWDQLQRRLRVLRLRREETAAQPA